MWRCGCQGRCKALGGRAVPPRVPGPSKTNSPPIVLGGPLWLLVHAQPGNPSAYPPSCGSTQPAPSQHPTRSPLSLVMVIFSDLPEPLSTAATFRMPAGRGMAGAQGVRGVQPGAGVSQTMQGRVYHRACRGGCITEQPRTGLQHPWGGMVTAAGAARWQVGTAAAAAWFEPAWLSPQGRHAMTLWQPHRWRRSQRRPQSEECRAARAGCLHQGVARQEGLAGGELTGAPAACETRGFQRPVGGWA